MLKILPALFLFTLSCSASPTRVEPPLTKVVEPVFEPVLMDSLRVFGSVVFHDELIAAGDALALRLSDLGPFAPIHASSSPYTDLTRDWARVAGGEYVKAGQCSDPPSPALAIRSLHPDAVGAEVRITCKQGCVLTVLFRDSETKAQGRDYHDRVRSKWTLDLTGEVNTWANQIATSTFTNVPLEAPKGVGGIMGMLVGSDDTPRIIVRDEEFSGEWGDTYSKAAFDAAIVEFGQCAQEARTWRDWWGTHHLLEVNTAGKVVRCENAIPDHLPMTTFDCECDALKSKVDFGPGQIRRMSAYLNYSTSSSKTFGSIVPGKVKDPFVRSSYLTDFSGEDPFASALGTNALSYEAFNACTKNLPVMEQKIPVLFSINGQGNVTGIEASWTEELKDFGTCAEPILRQAKFACPHSATTLLGNLKIKVEPFRR